MNDDHVKGAGKKITGSLKEAIGKVTGDKKTQAEGTAEKAAGHAESVLGKSKDKVAKS